jgi:hypothetical protein
MMNSPFAHMAAALQRAPVNAAPQRAAGAGPTAAMLQALAQGPCDAAHLAAVAGVRSALVMPLLKNHLKAGRVMSAVHGGRTVYELQSAEAADLARQIRRACQLLRAHGFVVEPRNTA